MRKKLFCCIYLSIAFLSSYAQSNIEPSEKGQTQTADSLNIEMIFVQGGAFTMGCTSEQNNDCDEGEKLIHQVTVDDFYISKYETTQAQWIAVMDSNPSYFKGGNLPVETISWEDVQKFIRKLNAQTGKQYRLPTEAEWEFACRGGLQSAHYKYSGSDIAGKVAWYDGNSDNKTHPVGTKSPNELGIYDMSGNVLEWCSDWKVSYNSKAQTNPKGPSFGIYRVNRGGSFTNYARLMRVSWRNSDDPDSGYSSLGFRLACSCDGRR